jgi:transglutaminase-like putative cysteine protease
MKLNLVLTRDKSDTLLLLTAALLVLAPHALHLPLWISALCLATLCWRCVITLRGLRMPPLPYLLPLVMAAMAGIFSNFHSLLGREPGVAMLVLLLAFKTLEMHARRDLFVVIFLSFFLVLTNFFYSQTMATAAMMAISIVALLTAQLTFQYTGVVPPLARRLRLAGGMFALAVPLSLVLFIVFPRVQGPIWGMPADASGARSGLSDHMAPGTVASIAQSDEAAFRVRFDGPVPPQAELYWRAIVLSEFDGLNWSRLTRQQRRGMDRPKLAVAGTELRYQITQEPTNSRWLFALDVPRSAPDLEGNPVRIGPELELLATYAISQRVRYQLASHPRYRLDEQLDDGALRRYLQLPGGFNPRTRALGASLHGNPGERVAAALALFNRSFSYTLDPPLLGTDTMDDFLFNTRAGFCEHFAGAFVVLMRAAGVPARVVTGYQGGEFNPVDGYLLVRQADAHAWAEVWIAGRGWVRIDPTAAVAPERVQRNLASAIVPTPPFGIAGLAPLINAGFTHSAWLAQLRFGLSALGNGWNQWVLNYTPERQRNTMATLSELLGHVRMAVAAAAIALLVLLAQTLRRRQRQDRIDALYFALCRQLARRGLQRSPDEGPTAYSLRLRAQALAQLGPQRMAAIALFLSLYSAYKYSAERAKPTLAATLQRLLAQSA